MAKTKRAKTLSRFSIVENDDGYQVHVEDDDGETLELAATREQLEVIADTLDDLLASTETAEEVED